MAPRCELLPYCRADGSIAPGRSRSPLGSAVGVGGRGARGLGCRLVLHETAGRPGGNGDHRRRPGCPAPPLPAPCARSVPQPIVGRACEEPAVGGCGGQRRRVGVGDTGDRCADRRGRSRRDRSERQSRPARRVPGGGRVGSPTLRALRGAVTVRVDRAVGRLSVERRDRSGDLRPPVPHRRPRSSAPRGARASGGVRRRVARSDRRARCAGGSSIGRAAGASGWRCPTTR